MFAFRIVSVSRWFVIVVVCAHAACGAAPDGEIIGDTADEHSPGGPKVASPTMTDAGAEDAATALGAPVRAF